MTEKTHQMAGPLNHDGTLDSWKEIATHLKRTERTVRRWEREEGLPVRRQMHRSRASVYAYPSELDAWLASRQPKAEPRSAGLRRPLIMVAVLVLALTSAGSRFNASPVRAAGQRSGPVARMIISARDMDVNNFLDLRLSPDGQYVAYSCLACRGGGLFIRHLASAQTTALTSGRFTYHVAWSRDGKRIAYEMSMPDSALEVVEVETRKSTRLATGSIAPFDWSPDGSQLLAQQERPDGSSSLVLVSVPDGQITPLVSQGWAAAGYSSTAVFSPDGRYVAFSATENDNRDIFILTPDGSRKARVTASPGSDRFPLWSPDGGTIVYQSDSALMAIPVSEGRPSGQPRYLRDVGSAGNEIPEFPAGWSASLGYSYVSFGSAARAFYALPVDPESGRPTGGSPVHLPPAAQGLETASVVVWSADMKRLAYVGASGEISVFSTEDLSVRVFSTGVEERPRRLSWSGDGEHIFFERRNGSMQELTLRDGRVRPVGAGIQGATFPVRRQGKTIRVPSAAGRAAPSAPWFSSADGRHLYFYTDSGRLIVVDPDKQEERVLASVQDGRGELLNRVPPYFSPDGSRILFGRVRRTPNGPREDDLWVLATDGSGGGVVASITREVDPPPGGATPGKYQALAFAVWDPSGRRVAYADLNSLSVVDVTTGEQWKVPIPSDFEAAVVQQWAPDGRSIVAGLGNLGRVEFWAIENLLGTAAAPASEEP